MRTPSGLFRIPGCTVRNYVEAFRSHSVLKLDVVPHPLIYPGFDEWHSTEASASSSTTNCGCDPTWKNEGQGCIVGGGAWSNQALECTNYWSPIDLGPNHEPNSSMASCRDENNGEKVAAHVCVSNYTEKISGDDSAHIMGTRGEGAFGHARIVA